MTNDFSRVFTGRLPESMVAPPGLNDPRSNQHPCVKLGKKRFSGPVLCLYFRLPTFLFPTFYKVLVYNNTNSILILANKMQMGFAMPCLPLSPRSAHWL